jgi:hypothetical protein
MFIQTLDLSDEDIENLCADTVSHFKALMGGNLSDMLLYMGKGIFSSQDGLPLDWFERLDNLAKALIIQPLLMRDPYIVDFMTKSINRKIRDSYLGKLVLQGNYSPLVSDPYAQAEWALGLTPIGLLSEKEHYSRFWNERNASVVAGGRSPLTHHSEMMVLEMVENDELNEWYRFQGSSFIIPPNSEDTTRMADADFDGDLIFTTSSPEFIKGRQDGLPIYYDKRMATKDYVDEDSLWETDAHGFNSKVGLVTNVSSTYHTLKDEFDKDSPEWKELERRLILLRMYQGESIDTAKNGGLVENMPERWLKWEKVDENLPEPEKKLKELNNRLLADRRPEFTRWLYSSYSKRYRDEIAMLNYVSMTKFGYSFEDLLLFSERTEQEQSLVNEYKKMSFFINNDSVMNRVSRHMMKEVKEAKSGSKSIEFDHRILLSDGFSGIDKSKLGKMQELFKRYNAMRHSLKHGDPENYKSVEYIISQIRREAFSTISSNESELADIAVILTYGVLQHSTKAFAWNVFGNGIVENLLGKSAGIAKVPVFDDGGELEYLYQNYKEIEVIV